MPQMNMQQMMKQARKMQEQLLAAQPEGIDVCARMESADQAVLSTLK